MPEPPMTPADPGAVEARIAEAALTAIRGYERECDARRRADSQRVFGHPGASIPAEFPTEAGRRAAVAAVLAPLVAVEVARAVEPFDRLFADGPDTPCRTTWPDGTECVEVPMADLRAAFADAFERSQR